MLTTLLPPTAGSATVAGLDVATQGPEVRRAIGAALQEAALDDFLTGREHMDLQGGLHGLTSAERRRRGDELIARVGLTHAADRKVGGYSGGMKRRLDLALALVHEPSVLFLDEPTTGLDPQSRSALWAEVERLAREEGVTVFLTTQYLEEADVLADRVGIIDSGRIVAEGTPSALKARSATSRWRPCPPTRTTRAAPTAVLARFGPPAASSPKGAAVRLTGGAERLADVVRALDAEGIASPTCSSISRRSTTSSSRRPAARSRARRRTRPAKASRAPRSRRDDDRRDARRGLGRPTTPALQVRLIAGRSISRTWRQPVLVIAGDPLPADPARRQRRRAGLGTQLPGFPYRQLHQLRDRRLLRAGRAVRRDHRRHRARDRHPEGLPRPPRADAARGAGRCCSGRWRAASRSR